ncbi:MAG TPA: VCBS repeat-containing protein [Solirubrobacteraceae bacterium]|jgi:hypothetical protein
MLNTRRRRALVRSALAGLAMTAFAAPAAAGAAPAFDRFDEPFGNELRSVAAADLDGDGDRDLAVAVDGNNAVKVALGNGDGTYGARQWYSLPGSGNPTAVVAADLDGDGDRDLAATDQIHDAVVVLRNAGDGTFAFADGSLPVGDAPDSMAAGDLNGDAKPDLVTANSASATASVLLATGGGAFAPAVAYTTGEGPRAVALGDTDGDGDLDLAVASQGANSVTVRRNAGNGSFGSPRILPVGSRPLGVTVADLDADGDADVVSADYADSTVSVVRSLGGSGTFAAPLTYDADGARAVAAGDLDGDGRADLAVAGSNLTVRPGNGDGTFGAAAGFSTGAPALAVALAQLDGDGRLDAVTANDSGGNAAVFLQVVAPVLLSPPRIAGTPQREWMQSAYNSNWGGGRATGEYAWLRCRTLYLNSCAAIDTADATDDADYIPTAADSGLRLRLRIVMRNDAGTAQSTSAATRLIDAPTVMGPARVGTATPRSGRELVATAASFSGWQNSVARAWLRCDATGGGCTAIDTADATDDADYTPTSADSGHTLRLRETASNSLGTARTTSAPTRRVDAPTVQTLPAITGTPRAGQLLHAFPGTWSGAPSYAYIWLRCSDAGAGCAAIADATGADYTPVAADVGHRLRVRVVATNDHGSGVATSAATRLVAPAS